MPELLLELFSEEIPVRMQKRAADDLQRLVCDGLKKAGLNFDSAAAYATPRRLTLVIDGLPEKQPDVKDERKGPQVGAPEQALNGFLGSLGGLTLEDCEQREVKGKTFYFAIIDKPGKPTGEVLKDIIDTALTAMAGSWPKSMRWGENAIRWARPLHSILCLLGGAVVPVELGPVSASDTSKGHRFLSPEPFPVKDLTDYKAKLQDNKVMLDAAERREKIRADADALAKTEGLSVKNDEGLLDEVAGLVEWPVVLMGDIDDEFMAVPPEVLIAAMRGHQKYFSLLDKNGQLASKFIVVSNMESQDGGEAIVAGNERVLRARLSDTKFFWDLDRKRGLEARLPDLENIVFHAKLGSVEAKIERMEWLVDNLTLVIPGIDAPSAMRAAKLCKADLVTGMVGELPELQGLMGRYYALETGENDAVADAIADHYSPAGPNDKCPSKPASIAVALSDKIDTLVGFWGINEKPTGSKDPYALRRAALGVIRLIIENEIRLPLKRFLTKSQEGYVDQVRNELDVNQHLADIGRLAQNAVVPRGALDHWDFAVDDLLAFFVDRLKVHLKEKGVRHDLIDAVFALGEDDLVRVLARVDALSEFLTSDDGANLLVAYKRAANILKIEEKKNGQSYDQEPDQNRNVEQGEEAALLAALVAVETDVGKHLEGEDFTAAMTQMAKLRVPLDAFFDEVTVNSDDKDARQYRLQLLSKIRSVMGAVADFSKVEG